VYGALGCATEFAFTIAARRPKLPSPWMLPLYGLAAPLFPPVRDAMRDGPLIVRALAYGLAIIATEYATGRLLRRAFGAAPWSYEGARFAVDGVTRLDYLPFWALYGLGLEALEDRVARTVRA
jgi:hypothetical protein